MPRPTLPHLKAIFTKPIDSLSSAKLRRCAVLIDGDNVPWKIVNALFAYAKRHGSLASAQLFANFAGGAHASWASAIKRHGITAVQIYNSSAGKNAADIALAVAAIDLLHTDRIDTFVIVASDADLAPIVHRLKRSGAQVLGVGAGDASLTFRESCDAFLSYYDLLAGSVSLDIADEQVAAIYPSAAQVPGFRAFQRMQKPDNGLILGETCQNSVGGIRSDCGSISKLETTAIQ